MAADFLEAVHRAHGRGSVAIVKSGKAGSVGGSGLPLGSRGNFIFATGIECSAPTIQNGRVRRDQLEECGHYARCHSHLGHVSGDGPREAGGQRCCINSIALDPKER